MPTMTTDIPTDDTERRSVQERREQLVDAAVAVLAEDGLSRATTRAITDRAGLALGAFHYAFDSKDELLRAVTDRIVESMDATLRTTFGSVTARPDGTDHGAERVHALLEPFLLSLWDELQATPQLQLARFELTLHAMREPSLRTLASRASDRFVDSIADGISEVEGVGTDEDVEALARYIVATLDGLLLHELVASDPQAARVRLQHYLDSLEVVIAGHLDAAEH